VRCFLFAMAQSVAHIRAYQCELAQASQALEAATHERRWKTLQVLQNLLSDARSKLQPHQKMEQYRQHFVAEFDITILQINGEQHQIRVCGNTTIATVCAELASRLKREPQEVQLNVNSESCKAQHCLWQYGVVKGFSDQVWLLTFRAIDAYTRDVNAAKQEYSAAWQFERVGNQFEQLRKDVKTEILSKARENCVISEEESAALLQQDDLSIVDLCGILTATNQCEHHSCALCKKLENQSGDCSFAQWMEGRQQWHESAAANLLECSKSKLHKRKGDMEYSLMLAKQLRAWETGRGCATMSHL